MSPAKIYIAVAVLTLKGAGEMTKRERKQVAQWLRKQADALESSGDNYASRFRARYMPGFLV